MQQSVEAIDMDMVRVGIKEDWFGGINGAMDDAMDWVLVRTGCDCVLGVLFIVLAVVPKGQTPSARNKKKKKRDLARRRQSEHKFGSVSG